TSAQVSARAIDFHQLVRRADGDSQQLRFFFQAEDGIRYRTVTGVQTCALPISIGANLAFLRSALAAIGGWRTDLGKVNNTLISRSEERRVGKECRSAWSQ